MTRPRGDGDLFRVDDDRCCSDLARPLNRRDGLPGGSSARCRTRMFESTNAVTDARPPARCILVL